MEDSVKDYLKSKNTKNNGLENLANESEEAANSIDQKMEEIAGEPSEPEE